MLVVMASAIAEMRPPVVESIIEYRRADLKAPFVPEREDAELNWDANVESLMRVAA